MNIVVLILFSLSFFSNGQSNYTYQNELPEQEENQDVPSSTKSAISSILSVLLVILIIIGGLLYICYRNTNRIEKHADQFRQKLAEKYINGVRSNSQNITPVNEYLLRVIIPDRSIIPNSLFNSARKLTSGREKQTVMSTETERDISYSHFRTQRKGRDINFGDRVREDKTIMVPMPSHTQV
jgi:hypothetical protein